MNNIIPFAGIPTPRFKAQQIKQDLDQDLFVRMVNSHPGHIARAKAKRAQAIAAMQKEEEAARLEKEDLEKLVQTIGGLSVSTILTMAFVAALI